MNKTSKFSKILAVLSLVLCFALLFCACDNDADKIVNPPVEDNNTPGDNNNDENPGENTNPGNEDDGKITYTVNVKDYDGSPIEGVEIQFCVDSCLPPIYSDANGVATITLDPDDYHVQINPGVYAGDPAEYTFPEGSTTIDATVYKLPTGAEDDPIPVNDDEIQVKLIAGAKLYYEIQMPGNKTVTIEDKNGKQAVVEYNGVTYNSVDGKVTVALEGGRVATLAISSADGKLALFTMKVSTKAGTYDNPIVLNSLDSITVSVPEADSVHYAWIASASGTLTVSCANTQSDITLNNLTAGIYGDPSDGAASVSISVNAGDEILLVFAALMDETTWTTPAVDYTVSFTLA